MDHIVEESIVVSWIVKRKQERAVFELLNAKKREKREHFIWHFENYIDYTNAQKVTNSFASSQQLDGFLKRHGAPNICYVIALHEQLDGRWLPLKVITEELMGYGPFFICCIPKKLAYLECEQAFGAPNRFLLTDSRQ